MWIVHGQRRLQGDQQLVSQPSRWLTWSVGRQGELVPASCSFGHWCDFAVTVHNCRDGCLTKASHTESWGRVYSLNPYRHFAFFGREPHGPTASWLICHLLFASSWLLIPLVAFCSQAARERELSVYMHSGPFIYHIADLCNTPSLQCCDIHLVWPWHGHP